MNIITEKKDSKLDIRLEGRLDTTTAPELDKEIMANLDGVKDLTLDFSDLMYISSAGLRVILSCQKKMNAAAGRMVIKNANELVMEIFETTGLTDILTIENEA